MRPEYPPLVPRELTQPEAYLLNIQLNHFDSLTDLDKKTYRNYVIDVAASPTPVLRVEQTDLDSTIGRLDHVLSKLVLWSKAQLDEPNRQTLKHHAEDMIAAGQKILKDLGVSGAQ